MNEPWNWLRFSLCLSLVWGLSGCSSHKTSIDSTINFLVTDGSINKRNIGLAGGIPPGSEDITLSPKSDPTIKSGILHQMVQGAWNGALSGLETGQLFCWSSSGSGSRTFNISGKSGGADALIYLVLCGGGMVTGMSIGAAVGIVAPFVSAKQSNEILIARQHVIQGIWKGLVTGKWPGSIGGQERDGSIDDSSSDTRVIFGDRTQPFTTFVKFSRIRVGLFSKSYFTDKLTLVWDLQLKILNHRRRVVAEQTIEMEQGAYVFKEWANQRAFILKEKLEEGYGLIADEIARQLTQPALRE